ncbi:MAG: EamA family transporter, partial [Chromatiaceae bacterium]|nr:EamA family transporter [Chromatiaceae bacterium]
MNSFTSWQFWALLAAVFAALTAIFAKLGVEDVNSDFATFVRTLVIVLVLGGILVATDQFQPLRSISA